METSVHTRLHIRHQRLPTDDANVGQNELVVRFIVGAATVISVAVVIIVENF
jgi:hypothetical protein